MDNEEQISHEEETLTQNQILHNRHVRIIEKLDLLQSEISNTSHVMNDALINLYSHINKSHIDNYIILDRIDKSLFWFKFVWYIIGILSILGLISRACGFISS